ncbi:MAG: cysteine desulfurase [Candidatus Omnitrophica bacterium]|nr:cysteine desulfurase [Candidatus Omnitrophota bacterium]MBU1091171.1 cysteine desulfurase [Candidatus Omnitrophota bacterium]
MAKRKIYLDHNATTPLHPEVKKALKKAMEVFGNPSSLHSFGREARRLVEQVRGEVASFIGAAPEEVIFVGSGSEANNTALSIFTCSSSKCTCTAKGGTRIITTSIEHPCILETSKCLQDRGTKVSFLEVDQYGKIKIEKLKSMISDETGLISVMMANNEIGTTQDIKAVAKIAHARGILFHTDAVQAVGKIPVDVKDLDADFLTLSAHKIYGPKGIGVLYVKKGIPFCSLIHGGHQEQGRRAGTENTLGIIGLGKAVQMRAKEMGEEEKRLLKLKTILKNGIEEKISNIQFNGHPRDCLTNTLNVSFEGAEGEAILLYLDLEGIAVSTGSACASGSLDPSHVLLATGVSAERAHGSIRISMGRDNTIKDVECLLDKLPKVIKKIRGMSTSYIKKGER